MEINKCYFYGELSNIQENSYNGKTNGYSIEMDEYGEPNSIGQSFIVLRETAGEKVASYVATGYSQTKGTQYKCVYTDFKEEGL